MSLRVLWVVGLIGLLSVGTALAKSKKSKKSQKGDDTGAVTLEWAATGGAAGSESAGTQIVPVGSDGDVVVVGTVFPDGTFGAGEPNETTILSNGVIDGYVARYTGDGRVVWLVPFASSGLVFPFASPRDVAVGKDGAIYVAGYFFETLEVDGETLESPDGDGGFLARFDEDGALAWIRQLTSDALVEALCVAVPDEDTVLIGGLYASTTWFDPTTSLTTGASLEAFLAAYDSDGNLAWVRSTASAAGDTASIWGIDVLPKGDIAVAGDFAGQTAFGPGEETETVVTSTADSSDVFVARLDATGALLWVQTAGSPADDEAFDVSVGPGDTFSLCGRFRDEITFGSGKRSRTLTSEGAFDGFVATYDKRGRVRWLGHVGGPGNDGIFRLARQGNGRLLAVGAFRGTADVTDGKRIRGTLAAATAADTDALLIRWQQNGKLERVWRFGGSGMDMAGGVSGTDERTMLVTGLFTGTATLGPVDDPWGTVSGVGTFDALFFELSDEQTK